MPSTNENSSSCRRSVTPRLTSTWASRVEKVASSDVKMAMEKAPNTLRSQLLMDEAWPLSSRGICSMPAWLAGIIESEMPTLRTSIHINT